MFSNNSYSSQVDKENKNPDNITIYNESIFPRFRSEFVTFATKSL